MKFLAVLLILQSSLVFAEKKLVQKDLSLLGKIDEESFKKVEPSKPVNDFSSEKSNLTMSCKDGAGKEFKKGDAGYETCILGMNKKDKKDSSSANFNFKIGN